MLYRSSVLPVLVLARVAEFSPWLRTLRTIELTYYEYQFVHAEYHLNALLNPLRIIYLTIYILIILKFFNKYNIKLIFIIKNNYCAREKLPFIIISYILKY